MIIISPNYFKHIIQEDLLTIIYSLLLLSFLYISGMWAMDAKVSVSLGFKWLCVAGDMELMRAAAAEKIAKLSEDLGPTGWTPKPKPIDPSDV